MNIPLPKSLEEIINRNFKNISNLNLLLTKYVRGWKTNWEFESWEFESKEKGEYLDSAIKTNYDKTTYNKFLQRWKLLLNSINAVQITGKVLWRLVVGLGSGSVLETSMTLHHILGVPYIPATALKGVVSSYYIEKNRETLTDKMEKINNQRTQEGKKEYKSVEEFVMNEDKNHTELFGNENQKGKVTFLDAYPTEFPKLEIDIMNPHYQDYYGDTSGMIPPADWMNPKLIKFLTIAKSAEFIFAFKAERDDLIDEVKTLIRESLGSMGIGAKTSVGYGYFRNFKDVCGMSSSSPTSIPGQKQTSGPQKQKLPNYLKSETELKDEYLRPDKTMKSEKEYEEYLERKGKVYNKERKQKFEKARKWYEKNRGVK